MAPFFCSRPNPVTTSKKTFAPVFGGSRESTNLQQLQNEIALKNILWSTKVSWKTSLRIVESLFSFSQTGEALNFYIFFFADSCQKKFRSKFWKDQVTEKQVFPNDSLSCSDPMNQLQKLARRHSQVLSKKILLKTFSLGHCCKMFFFFTCHRWCQSCSKQVTWLTNFVPNRDVQKNFDGTSPGKSQLRTTLDWNRLTTEFLTSKFPL